MIEPRAFRDTLGRFATGVTIVTMDRDGTPAGITVNAFLSLSLEPPLVGVAIDLRAGAHDTLMSVERFGVSVLGEHQREVSDYFAGLEPAEPPPFVRLGGVPVVKGAIAHLACRIVQRVPVGDHTLFVGEVEALALGEGSPLVFFRGGYGLPGPAG